MGKKKKKTVKKLILVLALFLPLLFGLDMASQTVRRPATTTWEERVEGLEARVEILEKKVDSLTEMVFALHEYQDVNIPGIAPEANKHHHPLTLEERQRRLKEVKKEAALKREQRLQRIKDQRSKNIEALERAKEWQKNLWGEDRARRSEIRRR